MIAGIVQVISNQFLLLRLCLELILKRESERPPGCWLLMCDIIISPVTENLLLKL